MMTDNPAPDQPQPASRPGGRFDASRPPSDGKHGLSWPAFFDRWIVRALSVVLLLVVAVAVLFFDGFSLLAKVPIYIVIGVLGSFAWFPHLLNLHRKNETELVVFESPDRLTLYRVGRKAGLDIIGHPINMISRSGVERLFVTGFDLESRLAVGSQIAGASTFDFFADTQAFTFLSEAYTARLKEEQITKELVVVKAQELVKERSDQWLRIAMATQDPQPIYDELVGLEAAGVDNMEYEEYEDYEDEEGGA